MISHFYKKSLKIILSGLKEWLDIKLLLQNSS